MFEYVGKLISPGGLRAAIDYCYFHLREDFKNIKILNIYYLRNIRDVGDVRHVGDMGYVRDVGDFDNTWKYVTIS